MTKRKVFAGVVERHRAARHREVLSTPARAMLENNWLNEDETHFDYGCGYGDDVKRLTEMGYRSHGYDPYYFKDTEFIRSDVVTLFYVLNFIEDVRERDWVLANAFNLADKRLIVAALIKPPVETNFEDGRIFRANVFAMLFNSYKQLKNYIEIVLGVPAKYLTNTTYGVQKLAEKTFAMPFHKVNNTQREELIEQLMYQTFKYQRDFLPPTGSVVERYTCKGHEYMRLRSPIAFDYENKTRTMLYAGIKHSPKYYWAIKALERRKLYDIAIRRLNHLNKF